MQGTKIRLWKYTNKQGKTYLSGPMSRVSRLVVILNDRKDDSKDPDAYAFIVPDRGPGHVAAELDDS